MGKDTVVSKFVLLLTIKKKKKTFRLIYLFIYLFIYLWLFGPAVQSTNITLNTDISHCSVVMNLLACHVTIVFLKIYSSAGP